MQTIDGYDPVAKKWTVAGFDADGSFYMGTTEFAEMKKDRRLGPGVIGTAEEKLFKTDGTTTIITSKLSCLELTENRVVLVWAERKENGQPKPDLKLTCERQLESERKVLQ